MIVLCENRQRKHPFEPMAAWSRQTVTAVVAAFAPPFIWQKQAVEPAVHVHFVSPARIKTLKREARDVDQVTDVLSFPLLHWTDGKPAAPLTAGELDFSWQVEPIVWLGDLIICPEQAARQSRAYEHSMQREIAFLCAHGTLHLIGYDHQTPEQEQRMFSKQRAILYNLGYHRTAAEEEEGQHE